MRFTRLLGRVPRPVIASAALLMATAAGAAPLDPARVDVLFSAFTSQTPGCAAAVVRAGRTIYARGFGLADLSHRVRIEPDTVFEIGSVSKQFTAVAILLLQADGMLRLDDSVQQHLPELAPLVPQRISLRQLLHHTGGLGGYQELLDLAGVPYENVVGAPEALRAFAVLPQLHGAPGTRFSYSDTGYFLLAQVVARVSGDSMDALLQARVFGPLGMTSSYIYNDHRRVVPLRARAYAPRAGTQAWELNESNWIMDGDAGVHSTVLDLARWGAEVTRPRVLPPGLFETLRTPGRLNDGTPLPYGMGQQVGSYRGLPRVSHSGAWVGYGSMLMHFPTQDTSVAVSCNTASARVGMLAEQVADEVLAPMLAPMPSPPLASATAGTRRYLGQYLNESGFELARITADAAGTLSVQLGSSSRGLLPTEDGGLRSTAGTLRLRLSDDGQALGVSATGRATEAYRRVAAFTPSPADSAALAGTFRQAALGATLTVTQRADGLAVQFNAPGGPVEPLLWLGADHLAGPAYLLRIERDSQRHIVALLYLNERVRGLRYARER